MLRVIPAGCSVVKRRHDTLYHERRLEGGYDFVGGSSGFRPVHRRAERPWKTGAAALRIETRILTKLSGDEMVMIPAAERTKDESGDKQTTRAEAR